ncbi:hypothetical protein N425_12865 [Tannerella sp. oral taxon BU063 isolate Cell 2]|uniref:Uncharacterized protein n=1 Tax=Tannerella sp. oral taxon BU063 isolate Cell 2 TaxID=1411148 RepID=W2C0W4_9BACT|nr:hypothetical protein N425_12865 [Tannerella sp. oral taxon BU063 isolate Cell 2]
MEEKKAKEDQGIRDAGQFFRVRYALTASDSPAFRP